MQISSIMMLLHQYLGGSESHDTTRKNVLVSDFHDSEVTPSTVFLSRDPSQVSEGVYAHHISLNNALKGIDDAYKGLKAKKENLTSKTAAKPNATSANSTAAESTPVAKEVKATESDESAHSLHHKSRVQQHVYSPMQYEDTCVTVMDFRRDPNLTSFTDLKLPEWIPRPPIERKPILAYLIQASNPKKMKLMQRVLRKIYTDKDIFVYHVDETNGLTVSQMEGLVKETMEGVPNVHVTNSTHAGYFYFPRVDVVLKGMNSMLSYDWDFMIHLSESGYPLHSPEWTRAYLEANPVSYVQIQPRCTRDGLAIDHNKWWFWQWPGNLAVMSCVDEVLQSNTKFPQDELGAKGVMLAHGSEWTVLKRSLVEYALMPELKSFKRMASLRMGADELFWQTMLLNIPGFDLDREVTPMPAWYMQWTDHGDSPHSPDTLTTDDLTYSPEGLGLDGEKRPNPDIYYQHDSYLFMRKVDLNESHPVLDLVDSLMANDTFADIKPAQLSFNDQYAFDRRVAC